MSVSIIADERAEKCKNSVLDTWTRSNWQESSLYDRTVDKKPKQSGIQDLMIEVGENGRILSKIMESV